MAKRSKSVKAKAEVNTGVLTKEGLKKEEKKISGNNAERMDISNKPELNLKG